MLNKQLLKNFMTYSVGAVIARLLTASLTLATITIFTPAEFGLLALFNSFLVIAPVFLNLGLRQVFGLEFFHLPDNIARKKLLHELIITYLIIAIPVLILALGHLSILNKCLFLGQASYLTIIVALLICFLSFFSELFYQVLRYQQAALRLTVIQISAALVAAILIIWLVFNLKLQILGFLIANLASLLLVCGYAGYFYYQQAFLTSAMMSVTAVPVALGEQNSAIMCASNNQQAIFSSRQAIKLRTQNSLKYLKLGAPYVSSMIFAWILSASDRWILAYWGNLELVGIYALADSFGQLFNLVILNPLAYSYVPYMLEKFSQAKNQPAQLNLINQQNFKYMYFSIVGLASLVFLGFLIAKPIFIYLAPAKYLTAINYVLIILAGQVCLMGSYFATCYLQFQKRVYLQVGLTIGAALINISLNLLLVPTLQLYGCTLATLIAYSLYLWVTIKITSNILYKQVNK